MKVLRVVADSGVYFSDNTDPTQLTFGQGVRSYQQVEMSKEDYEKIPSTEEASKFFRGEVVGQRPKE